jgi:murein tripeptide amidase MpaA
MDNYREWKRLAYPIQSITINSEEELIVKFDFFFLADIRCVQFAFIYPYSHEQCHQDLDALRALHENDPELLFRQYELCRSYEGRVIDMLLISSHEGKDGFENIKTDGVFTLGDRKLQRLRSHKPVIFISARVHPIETPSSYTMTGVIKFLLDKTDYRAHLLRKFFVFVLVPMLNPDGVSNGHCRMDSLNQNLNRYYHNPDPLKQPSCYSVMKLCEYYNK